MVIDKDYLDKMTEEAKASERLRVARDLRTTAEDQSQRMLNAVEPGTQVPIHRHVNSSETMIVVRGALREIYYDDEGEEIASFIVKAGSDCPAIQIPKGQWHGIEVLESGTVIFEGKDGAYVPVSPADIMNK